MKLLTWERVNFLHKNPYLVMYAVYNGTTTVRMIGRENDKVVVVFPGDDAPSLVEISELSMNSLEAEK